MFLNRLCLEKNGQAATVKQCQILIFRENVGEVIWNV